MSDDATASLQEFGVSRETIDRMASFRAVLCRWNERINLVSETSLEAFWNRHVADSFGLINEVSEEGVWADMGSGAGFPVIPIAAHARSKGSSMRFVAVESDRRKAAFMREASRELGIDLAVVSERIEKTPALVASVISSRALAPLAKLLQLAERHMAVRGRLLALKGEGIHEELTQAAKIWQFTYQNQRHPLTSRGHILRIDSFARS